MVHGTLGPYWRAHIYAHRGKNNRKFMCGLMKIHPLNIDTLLHYEWVNIWFWLQTCYWYRKCRSTYTVEQSVIPFFFVLFFHHKQTIIDFIQLQHFIFIENNKFPKDVVNGEKYVFTPALILCLSDYLYKTFTLYYN